MPDFIPNQNALAWADALESGRFEQGRSYLEKGGKYCCLGVACVLAIEAGVNVERDTEYVGSMGVAYDHHTASLPLPVKDWLGLGSDNGQYRDDRGFGRTLVSDNDNDQHHFKRIAETVRSTPSLYRGS
jgi:hypothetical protein